MPLIFRSGGKTKAEKVDWADPGYFSGESVVGNSLRVLVQLIRPPKGHRTVPTKTGLMLILIIIGVGTAAFNTGQNVLYLVLALLLSTLLVSGILSWMNFKGCRWRLETGRHFRVGSPCPVYLEVQNTKKRLPSYALTFRMAARRSGTLGSLALDGRLDPGKQTRLLWEFVPVRRGLDSIALEGLLSRYPFGFLRKSIRDSFEREVVVWPARVTYRFAADKSGNRWLYGHDRRKGEGVELLHLREYRSGDPLRRIHWKATARMGSLQVREMEMEHHQAFSLFVDPSPNLWQEEATFEKMCAFAGSLAEDLYQRDRLRHCQVAGRAAIKVAVIEDLHAFLDQLGALDRTPVPRGAAGPDRLRDAVTFIPGASGVVLAQLEEATVGQA